MPEPLPVPRRTILRTLAAVPLVAALPVVAVPDAGPAHAGSSALWLGATGPRVREVQIRVAGWATDDPRPAALGVTGRFDRTTEAAVRRFQRAYGLDVTGAVDPATSERLTALAAPDGSTVSFGWEQFAAPDGRGFTGGPVDSDAVRENVRRLMYKLEALRHKAGGRPVTVRAGFHRHGTEGSTHSYGTAADVTVAGLTTYSVYRIAQTCGFSGMGSYNGSTLHCDSQVEHDGGGTWNWVHGVI